MVAPPPFDPRRIPSPPPPGAPLLPPPGTPLPRPQGMMNAPPPPLGAPPPAGPPGMMQGMMNAMPPPGAAAAGVMGAVGPPDPMTLPAVSDTGDPVLAQLMQRTPPPLDPLAGVPDEQKPGYTPKRDPGEWLEIATLDEEQYTQLLQRFSRDVRLYRQEYSAKPPGFDPKREIAFKAATLTNIVNKLTNMAAALDFRYEVPFKDEDSKRASQIMENWYTSLRKAEVAQYAHGVSGNLQWDEFFYDHLYGRIVCRILPAPEKQPLPFDIELLDPATVFPTWGGTSEGIVRLVHKRPMTAIDVIATYQPYAPNLSEKIKEFTKKVNADASDKEFRHNLHIERDLTECWDTWRTCTFWGDIVVHEAEHKLGEVPFVHATARGEPRGMRTPTGNYWVNESLSRPDEVDLAVPVSDRQDLFHKGVSVFHQAVNTHTLTEVVYSILATEIIKASKPATVNYIQQGSELPRPLDLKPGGTNYRWMNAQRVEIAPTSPRPTDASPVLQKLTTDQVEGTLNAAAYGNVEGSNIAGYAIESMQAAAKDTTLPYTRCFEVYQAAKAGLMCRLYEKVIAPIGVMAAPMDAKYGNGPSEPVTPEILRQTGHHVIVEIVGVSDQQLPMLINAAGSAVEKGFWSRRHAMERIGEKDPSRMNQEIIIERALEHPEMMENFLIPINFIRSGQKDLAELWVFMVVMPKVQAMMAKMLGPMQMGGAPPGGMPGMGGPPGMGGAMGGPMAGLAAMGGGGGGAMLGSGPPGGGAGIQGVPNPIAGRDRGAPTGPLPGQGRGPAPTPPPG